MNMNNKTTLRDTYLSHDGKGSDKWSSYLDAYEDLLSDSRDSIESILEIGVQNGGSLEIWSKYLPNSKNVVGVDINPRVSWLNFEDPKIQAFVGDASTPDVAEWLKKSYPNGFNVIIDDGSHNSGDIVRSFARLFEQVKLGGVYAIEDLHCSYWAGWDGGLYDPHSSMSFLKRLIDIVNYEHWGVREKRSAVLNGFAEKYGVNFLEDQLAQIRRVEFVNSICFIFKSDSSQTLMEPRMFSGSQELVAQVSHLADESYVAPDQTKNVWSMAESSHEKNISELERNRTTLHRYAQDLTKYAQDLTHSQTSLKQSINERLVEKSASEYTISEISRKLTEVERQCQDLFEKNRSIEVQLKESHALSDSLNSQLNSSNENRLAVLNSWSWRLMYPIRKLTAPIYGVAQLTSKLPGLLKKYSLGEAFDLSGTVFRKQGVRGLLVAIKNSGTAAVNQSCSEDGMSLLGLSEYETWIERNDSQSVLAMNLLEAVVEKLPNQMLISVVMPVYNPPLQYLRIAIDSLRQQVYKNWELCLADDASPNEEVKAYLRELALSDSRIKVAFRERNGHISAATNTALELATGEFIALMDNDDELPRHALAYVAIALNKKPDAEIIYSDEDKMTPEGRRYDPYFKSDFNYELFLAQNMISHLGVYRRSTVSEVGGFRVGMEGAQDWDLALRVLEKVGIDKIVHIPRVLYHWRAIPGSTAVNVDEKAYASSAQLKVIQGHLDRLEKKAVVIPAPGAGGMTRVKYEFSPEKVSIIIPTRDRVDLLKQCIDSIRNKSTYKNYEIIIANNDSALPESLEYFCLLKQQGVKIIDVPGEFNYSRINNITVSHAVGDLICLMNNDIEIISPDWIQEMGSFAQQSGVGCVGAKLWYPNDTLQHGGVVLGIAGAAGHAFKGVGRDNFGYFGRAILHQSYSAVTAACLMVRKDIYDEVSGLDELLAIAYNDVDFCLRIKAAGYRNIWTPYAEMYHHESASRGDDINGEKQSRLIRERNILLSRWRDIITADPGYSVNLTLDKEDFSWAVKSRVALDELNF